MRFSSPVGEFFPKRIKFIVHNTVLMQHELCKMWYHVNSSRHLMVNRLTMQAFMSFVFLGVQRLSYLATRIDSSSDL